MVVTSRRIAGRVVETCLDKSAQTDSGQCTSPQGHTAAPPALPAVSIRQRTARVAVPWQRLLRLDGDALQLCP